MGFALAVCVFGACCRCWRFYLDLGDLWAGFVEYGRPFRPELLDSGRGFGGVMIGTFPDVRGRGDVGLYFLGVETSVGGQEEEKEDDADGDEDQAAGGAGEHVNTTERGMIEASKARTTVMVREVSKRTPSSPAAKSILAVLGWSCDGLRRSAIWRHPCWTVKPCR